MVGFTSKADRASRPTSGGIGWAAHSLWCHPTRYHSLKHTSFGGRLAPVLIPLLAACTSPSPFPAPAGASLAPAESLYADLRSIRDRIDVNTEAGRTPSPDAILRHNALAAIWPVVSPPSTPLRSVR